MKGETMERVTVAQRFASVLNARRANIKYANDEGYKLNGARLEALKELLPSGSGFDNGTELEEDSCTDTKLVFTTSFHHMDENGYYCGWSEHRVTAKARFCGLDITVSGRNVREIKDFISETFHQILSAEYKEQV